MELRLYNAVFMLLGGNVSGVVSVCVQQNYELKAGGGVLVWKAVKSVHNFEGLPCPPGLLVSQLMITTNIAVVHLHFWRARPYARYFALINLCSPIVWRRSTTKTAQLFCNSQKRPFISTWYQFLRALCVMTCTYHILIIVWTILNPSNWVSWHQLSMLAGQ